MNLESEPPGIRRAVLLDERKNNDTLFWFVNKEEKDLAWIAALAAVLLGLFLLRLLPGVKHRAFIPVPGDVKEGQFCPLCIGSAQGRLRLSLGGGYILRCTERPMKHFRVVNDEERAKIDQNLIA